MAWEALAKYVPEGSMEPLAELLEAKSVLIKITRGRRSKLGDYRPLREGRYLHQITLNRDMNLYQFLVTFVHEIAHLYTFEKYRGSVAPHGDEWKNIYVGQLAPFLGKEYFPKDVEKALHKHIRKPGASSCRDTALFRVLQSYDEPEEGFVTIEALKEGSPFIDGAGRKLIRGPRRQKYYTCFDERGKPVAYFFGLAKVRSIE